MLIGMLWRAGAARYVLNHAALGTMWAKRERVDDQLHHSYQEHWLGNRSWQEPLTWMAHPAAAVQQRRLGLWRCDLQVQLANSFG